MYRFDISETQFDGAAGSGQAPGPGPLPGAEPGPLRPRPGPGEGEGGPATLSGDDLPPATADNGAGQIDYRLARKMVVDQFHAGRLSRVEVCDAHPELLRAARNVGEATAEDCPICEESKVVLVSYAFGPRLPASGTCVTSRAQMAKLARHGRDLACYVVEVCPECSWNHLARTFRMGGRAASVRR